MKNQSFGVAKDALDASGFKIPIEVILNLMLHPSISKWNKYEMSKIF